MSWDPPLPYAILLQDVNGQVEYKSVSGYGYSFRNQYVLRGTLLARLPQLEVDGRRHQEINPPMNFRVLKEPAVTLHCKMNDVLLLNYEQKELLLPIGSTNDRFEAVDKMEWAEKLTLGSLVYVSIPTLRKPAEGVVHYFGKLPGEDGTKFGIELLVCKLYTRTYNVFSSYLLVELLTIYM